MQAFFCCFEAVKAQRRRVSFSVLVGAAVLAMGSSPALAWSLDDVAKIASQRASVPFKEASQAVPAERRRG